MKKRVFSAILILVLLISQTGVFAHWADPYFASLSEKGIMFGDDRGFRGDDPLLRCEFAAMLNRAFSFSKIKNPVMPDVHEGDWYYEDLYTLCSAGIMNGDSNGKINPKYPITRAEASVMIWRTLKTKVSQREQVLDEEDVPIWASDAVLSLMQEGILNGYPDGKFYGGNFLLRGEAAVVIKKATDTLSFKEGDGSLGNPYIISNERQVENISKDLYASYKLNCDLDFTEIEFPMIGTDDKPFNGSFDGNGHKITVRKVKDGNNSLFKKVGKLGEIKNVYLVCPENRISIASINNGNITMCANTTWKGTNRDYSRVFGGIAGENNGEISYCYNLSSVVKFESGYIAGGIAGVNNKTISNCFNGGEAETYAGGIAGENNGKIENGYSFSGKVAKYNLGEVVNPYENKDAFYKFSEEVLKPIGMKYLSNEDFSLFAGGDGSLDNPYIIENGTHFKNIGEKPDKAFVQAKDIEITDSVKTFSGSYDGNGFYINALRIRGNEEDEVAMFVENRGTLKNILVKDGLISGNSYVSGIAVFNYGTISNCGFYGLVTGVTGGGISKINYEGGEISQCYFNGRVATDRFAGGIVSENYGNVTDVYSTAEVFGNPSGGVINYNKGTLERCYFRGKVNDGFGGIAYENLGNIQSGYTTLNSTVTIDEGASGFVTSRTEEEFKYPEMLMGLNFIFVWNADASGYPKLKFTPELKNNSGENLTEFSGGNGSVTNPYKIATPSQLLKISAYPNKSFVLLGSIDLSEYTSHNLVKNICEKFSGTLDGNGQAVKGLNLTQNGGALFNENAGVILNLGIESSVLQGENSSAFAIVNSGIIQDCYSNVTLKKGGAGVALFNQGTITRSWSAGEIKGLSGAGISEKNNGEISKCYSVSDIYADNGTGISNEGKIKESWFGGILYGDNIVPLPKSASRECFYLNYYGHYDRKGVTIYDEIDECFSQSPWVWKEGMPVLGKMASPEIETFRNIGNGTADNPYRITKAEHLKYLGMYNDSCFSIDKNIDASGKQILNIKEFSGKIFGNGKRISDFSVKSEKGGLIGEFSGEIKDLTISDYSIEGKDVTGGIVAVNNGRIENVSAINGRTGTNGHIAGGIAGQNNRIGQIISCLNYSDVFSTQMSGGICGQNNGTIVLSANHGGIVVTADAEDAFSGGIAGKTEGRIEKCYNNGKILSYSEFGKSVSGGVAGLANGSILNAYNTGEITAKAKTKALSGGILGLSDNSIEISNTYNTGFTNATADISYQGSAAAKVKNGSLNAFVYEHTLMPPIADGYLNENLVFAYPEDMFIREVGFSGFDFENVWGFSYDNGYYFPQLFGNEQDERALPENRTEFAGGDGTLENPYKIITPEQLNNVRKHLGSTFMLIGDIDMSGYCKENEFLPIGDTVFSFFGMFIGNNYKITGLEFSGNDFGLFRENHGEIYNVMFDNINGTGSGGTVAKSNTGLIYNCVNTGAQTEFSSDINLNRGGLVGINKSTGMIISSYNSGNLEFSCENVQAGGLAHANYGIISGSFNSGTVKTNAENLSVSGGIVASNFGVISDCYNADATVSTSDTSDSFSGGITGNNAGTVVNCYFSGIKNPDAKLAGGIAGTNSGRLVNCYFNGLHGVGRNSGNIFNVVACTTEKLMQKETFSDFDFENMWIIDSSFNYKCPQLIEIAHRD